MLLDHSEWITSMCFRCNNTARFSVHVPVPFSNTSQTPKLTRRYLYKVPCCMETFYKIWLCHPIHSKDVLLSSCIIILHKHLYVESKMHIIHVLHILVSLHSSPSSHNICSLWVSSSCTSPCYFFLSTYEYTVYTCRYMCCKLSTSHCFDAASIN